MHFIYYLYKKRKGKLIPYLFSELNFAYVERSKIPCPEKLNKITLFSPFELAAFASSIATLIACAVSGAGRIPSVCANNLPATNVSYSFSALASTNLLWLQMRYYRRISMISKSSRTNIWRSEIST